MLAYGACRKNRKVFQGKNDNITLPRGCERGTFKRLYNSCFCLVVTLWKDLKTLQCIRSLKKILKTEVTQRRGQELINVQCPTDIPNYQQNINGFDRGDQVHEHCEGF